jgi:hypothetical protein
MSKLDIKFFIKLGVTYVISFKKNLVLFIYFSYVEERINIIKNDFNDETHIKV